MRACQLPTVRRVEAPRFAVASESLPHGRGSDWWRWNMSDRIAMEDMRQKAVRLGAVGVLSRGSEYLLIRRAPGILKGGYWCFPGGHVEPGETAADAVRRELAEELGIVVEPVAELGSVSVVEGDYILAVWKVSHISGEFRLKPDEIAEMRWLTPEEIRDIKPTLPSNPEVLRMLGH